MKTVCRTLLPLLLLVSPLRALYAGTPAAEIRLTGDVRGPARAPLAHYWSLCVGAGRANEGLRASWLEQLKVVHDACGFGYVRFHGLFHDDMFVYREAGGKPVYNWQYIDDLFDRMLAIGVRPFVELSFSPKTLASDANTVFWWKANSSPPKDYAKWADLVGAFAQHCIVRYGIDEVRQWYFEVWNEPDLHGFWSGTRSQYFELYAVSARALKAIDPTLRVGGPATSNFVADGRFDGETQAISHLVDVIRPEESEQLPWRPVWVQPFLEYCAAQKLPVDFISTHPYPTDWALDGSGKGRGVTRQVEATPNDLRLLRKLVDASPYPQAAIHLTEWSTTPSPRDYGHDTVPAATYVVKANLESVGLVDSLAYWTFTDVFEEGGAGNTIFHGGFGLINYQGIVKPTFHAYRLLHTLGDEIVMQVPGGIVTRRRDTGRIAALVYHYPAEMPLTVPANDRQTETIGTPIRVRLELGGLKPGAPLTIETLDFAHGNALAAWNALGSPASPTREQTQTIRAAGLATLRETVTADAAGRLSLDRELQPWSVVSIRE